MKFLSFTIFDVTQAGEMAKVSDKVWSNPPKGVKMLANHMCLSDPFPGLPMNSMVSVAIIEADNAEALAGVSYPMMLAGATIERIPVMELAVGGAAKAETKAKGKTTRKK